MVIGQRGPIHFSAIAREVRGISVKVLTEQLRDLVENGVLNRIANESRPEVYYELTPRGRELKLALDSLNELADRWPRL
jgi:DNA-binding HxlR family transcriptional regulator